MKNLNLQYISFKTYVDYLTADNNGYIKVDKLGKNFLRYDNSPMNLYISFFEVGTGIYDKF